MRSSREENVTAPIRPPGRLHLAQPEAAAALAQAPCRFVSCLLWRTASDWSIPPRRIDDLFLFLPVSGTLVVAGPAGSERLAAGALAVVPPGVEHAVAYAGTIRTCRVLALHAHVRTSLGAPWQFPADRLVARLPGHRTWIAALQRLAALAEDHPPLAAALGPDLVRRLLVDVVLAGHPAAPPAGAIDPRLAAIVQEVQADPGRAPPVAALARRLGLGPLRLRQLFQAGLGCSPKSWIDRLRLAQAARRLDEGETVAGAARAAGFGSVRQLQARFRAAYGCAPSAWSGRCRRGMM